MEIVIELLVELVGQFLLEVVADAGFRSVGKLLSNRYVRAVLGGVAAIGAGLAAGAWWGARLTEAGRTDPPSSLWVSLALASAFLALAVVRWVRETTEPDGDRRHCDRLRPWAWSPLRLLAFATLNASVAVGIALGFTPLRLA